MEIKTKTNKKIYKLLVSIIFVLCLLTLTGCGYIKDKKAETKEILTEFFGYIKEDKRAEAFTLIHKESHLNETLNSVLYYFESKNNINLSDEIIIGSVTSFNITKYTSEYKGEVCEMTFKATINDTNIYIDVLTVNNDNGYGIYTLDIYKK